MRLGLAKAARTKENKGKVSNQGEKFMTGFTSFYCEAADPELKEKLGTGVVVGVLPFQVVVQDNNGKQAVQTGIKSLVVWENMPCPAPAMEDPQNLVALGLVSDNEIDNDDDEEEEEEEEEEITVDNSVNDKLAAIDEDDLEPLGEGESVEADWEEVESVDTDQGTPVPETQNLNT
jgi:hypothetical protein